MEQKEQKQYLCKMSESEKLTWAKSLLQLLEGKELCMTCPDANVFDQRLSGEEWFCVDCDDCRAFINLPPVKWGADYDGKKCPCMQIGPDEARKLTWITLEEGGYLDE
jgi:hypothetical protein